MSLSPLTDKRKKKTADHINGQCSILAKAIESKHDELINALLEYESFETAEDEIRQSLDCLQNINKESGWLSYGKVNLMCTVIPINLPLYSLIIFVIIPGFMSEEMVVRSPVLMKNVLQDISEILDLKLILPHIKFVNIDRTSFDEAYVSVSDVVIFTGHYENAKVVQKSCPEALFIYDGTGINPIIITSSADINTSVEKTIKTRVFNSGQDCAGSDAIFVHEKIADDFRNKLITKLDNIKIGDYRNREVRIGRIIKADNLPNVKDFFDKHSETLIYGGEIDFDKKIVYPTVIAEDIRDMSNLKMTEFFAPVFYTLTYHNDKDLERYFSDKNYSDYAMYVSIFGTTPYASKIPNSVILQNKIVNDIERGNDPYGGYGPKANFVSYNNAYYHRPLLISREIYNYLKDTDLNNKDI